MERYRLKWIMILILAILNFFLILYLLRGTLAEEAVRRQTEKNLIALFAADGISLPRSAISHETPPQPVRLLPGAESEQEAAALLLGKDAVFSDEDGVREYSNGFAAVRFGDAGAFSAFGLSIRENPETLYRRFCRRWSLRAPDLPDLPDGAFTAYTYYKGLPVYNAETTFFFEDGILRDISGTLLAAQEVPVSSDTTLLTAAGALAAFQSVWRTEHVVASEVQATSLRFRLDWNGRELVLQPVWLVVTDAVDYYVDCATGAVTSE